MPSVTINSICVTSALVTNSVTRNINDDASGIVTVITHFSTMPEQLRIGICSPNGAQS